MSIRATDPTAEVLEPKLTPWDKRVLASLDVWPEHYYVKAIHKEQRSLDWRTAWQVAERVNEEDVAYVRRTLEGLVRFGYASDSGLTPARGRKRWIATPWNRRSA